MARFFKHLLLSLPLWFAACQEGGEAGDLLGQWRMNGNGSSDKYIGFSGNLTVFRLVENNVTMREEYGKFQHVGDSLFMQCYPFGGPEAGVGLIEGDFGFKPLGDIRLRIDVLSSDRLVLSKDGQQWHFYKY